jgi:hypothetical protein
MPLDSLTLGFPDGRSAFLPGEAIEVDVAWQLEEPAEQVELRLVWSTAGTGSRDLGVVGRRALGAGRSGGKRERLRLPESPYSFSGTLISLRWNLELVVDGGRSSTQLGLVIAPERREVSLRQPARPA